MARKINRLNARAAVTITKHGRHADGGGLYLSISPNGGRRWVFLYRWHSKPTEIGFGSARDVTLARARELARQARGNLADGINPKDARKPSEGATFGECADRVIEAMRPSWRNSKHAAQWEMTLRNYAAFIRSAGTVHTARSRSNSFQRAPSTSPERAAVRMANSSARAAIAWRDCKLVMKAATSAYAIAA